jgi:hypothetical protein
VIGPAAPVVTPAVTPIPEPVITPVPTPDITPRPVEIGTDWSVFVSHETDQTNTWMEDQQVLFDDLSLGDAGAAAIDASVIASDDTIELEWLAANPPQLCYANVHALVTKTHKESLLAMTDIEKRSYTAAAAHIENSTATMKEATSEIPAAGAACLA